MKTIFSTPAFTIAICGAMIFTSCKKDQTNVKSTGSALAFGVQADNTKLATASTSATDKSSAAANITWTSAVANIAAFKFEAKKDNTEIEIKTKNLTNVNLFSIDPALVTAAIDPGGYREIEIKVMLAKSAANIPLVIKGSFTTTSGNTIPVELDFNDDAIIKAEAENVTVTGKIDLSVIIALHLQSLLNNISASVIANAALTNNTILISSAANKDIYEQIKANLPGIGEAKHFEDHDRNDDKGHGNENGDDKGGNQNEPGDDKGSDG